MMTQPDSILDTIEAALNEYRLGPQHNLRVLGSSEAENAGEWIDKFQAQLAEIDAALTWIREQREAQAEWEIVPEYETDYNDSGMYIGRGLIVVWEEAVTITKNLPDNIRLMRRKDSEGGRIA